MRFYNVKSVADAQRKEELEKDKIYLSSNKKIMEDYYPKWENMLALQNIFIT